MNDFKEWLSDNLRYFLLAFIIILIIGAAILGISIYSKVVRGGGSQKEPTKQTEAVKEPGKETESAKKTDTESAKETEPQTKKETEPLAESEQETQPQTEAPTEPVTEAPTEPPTEAPAEPETEPQPVYLTMQGSCYLRAEPSTESEILGTYWVGTTVEFLEDVGGWYKVRVDGMTGYMGARFF